MIEIYFPKIIGLMIGFQYSNEKIEGVYEGGELRHVIQLGLLIVMININWYTK